MNPSIDKLINWFENRKNAVYYSMSYRNGQLINVNGARVNAGGRPGFDCSSAVYYALKDASYVPADTGIGNTDSLFRDLEKNGWVKTDRPQRGSIFIWGTRGASGGANGHTGVFLNSNDVIHCAAFANSITTNNYAQLRGWNGNPVQTIYTYQGAPYEGDTDQNLDVGSIIRFDKTYTVNDVQLIGGIWQIRTDELCREDFTWADNGIPAEPVYEVDGDGYATPDQNLDPGAQYVIPGKYTVLDIQPYKSYWLALIEWNGLKYWIDVETVTEIKANDPGRPVPGQRPAPTPPTPPPVEEPKPPVVEPEPPVTPEPEPEIPPTTPTEPQPEEPKPETPKPSEPKEDDMAFTQEEQRQLNVAKTDAQDIAVEIAQSDAVKEIVDGVSKRTKTIVYIVGDTLIGLGILTPQAAIVFGWTDVIRIVALSGLLAAAGAFLLTMFGIYKAGKKQ